MSRFCLLVLLGCLVIPAVGRSAENTWVGQRVMPKMNCELREKGRVIKDSKLNRVPYIVVQTQDDWLLVGDRVPGWVKKALTTFSQSVNRPAFLSARVISRLAVSEDERPCNRAIRLDTPCASASSFALARRP